MVFPSPPLAPEQRLDDAVNAVHKPHFSTPVRERARKVLEHEAYEARGVRVGGGGSGVETAMACLETRWFSGGRRVRWRISPDVIVLLWQRLEEHVDVKGRKPRVDIDLGELLGNVVFDVLRKQRLRVVDVDERHLRYSELIWFGTGADFL